MDTGERSDDDSQTTKVSGLKSGVLTGRTFTVVVVTNDDPLDALVAIFGSDGGDTRPFTSELVLDLVGFTVGAVDGSDKAVLYERRLWLDKNIQHLRRTTYGRCSGDDRDI